MGNKESATADELQGLEWPPKDEQSLASYNKGKKCPLTANEENVATFAMGWFWGPEARFSSKKGVVWTRVGYTGGSKKWPTYHSIGKHTEAVQVQYDPNVLTYEQLLDEFFEESVYYQSSFSSQYKTAIWYHGEKQQKAIEKKVEQIKATKSGKYGKVKCTIEPLSFFYKAEEYHQRYYAKMKH